MYNTLVSKQNCILKGCYLLKDNILLGRQYLTPIKILSSCFPYLTKYTHTSLIWINTYEGGRATLNPETGSATPRDPTCLCEMMNPSWHDVQLMHWKNQSHCQYPAEGTDLKTRSCPRQASGEGASVQWTLVWCFFFSFSFLNGGTED